MGILKFKIITDNNPDKLEEKVNAFISESGITVVDKQFTAAYNGSSIWKYVTIWYTSIDALEFKKIK